MPDVPVEPPHPLDFRCFACRLGQHDRCRWAEGCECACPWTYEEDPCR